MTTVLIVFEAAGVSTGSSHPPRIDLEIDNGMSFWIGSKEHLHTVAGRHGEEGIKTAATQQ